MALKTAIRAGVLAMAGVIALAACAAPQAAAPVACPRVLVDEDVGSLTRFRDGGGRDITDIVVQAAIARIAGACEVTDEVVSVEFGIELVAERGAAGGATVDMPLFVAVIGGDGAVIDRQAFSERAGFEGNRTQVALRDVFVIDIPRQQGVATDSYQIYVGFELSRDEVAYNRAQRAR